MHTIDDSRQLLLDEIGPTPDLTFIRGYGNIGDELIWAGTRRLLDGHVYREISLDELSSSGGDTALLCGGGAFSHHYNEFMPEALAIAEMRFDRVIVLPSTFDVEEERVRNALRRTKATVFARERESFSRIAGLCDARLAHDCAFFFDFSPYSTSGTGTLSAFRTDHECAGRGDLPPHNNDLSVTCRTLDEWLSAIAQHAVVHTDRAHVMIAAALMGKEVGYSSSSYFKVDAIAESCLQQCRVAKLPHPPEPVTVSAAEAPIVTRTRDRLRELAMQKPARKIATGHAGHTARVTAVILSRDRPDTVLRAIDSVLSAEAPVKVLVLDQASSRRTRDLLRTKMLDPRVDVRLTNRNLHCSGGRQHAVEMIDTEFVHFLDDDAELMPGALEHMIAELDEHPEAMAVTPFVVYADGTMYHFGGWVERSRETVRFEVHGHCQPVEQIRHEITGPTGWAPGTAALIRRRVFDEVPLDTRLSYFEDNDWSLRVDARWPRSFRRCREAIVMHSMPRKISRSASFIDRARTVMDLVNHARFLHTHGVVLVDGVSWVLPELIRPNGGLDLAAAKLLLEIVLARGVEWTLMEWMNGGLTPVFASVQFARAEQMRAEIENERQTQFAYAEQMRAQIENERQNQLAYAEQMRAAIENERQTIASWKERSALLDLIENGPWWRLRSRLLPLRPAVVALRQLTRRVGGHG
jgi:GT2 family glycosyltransferase/exopolysaccharide biosynthesis predicted pyruvyltransferase EpsI